MRVHAHKLSTDIHSQIVLPFHIPPRALTDRKVGDEAGSMPPPAAPCHVERSGKVGYIDCGKEGPNKLLLIEDDVRRGWFP